MATETDFRGQKSASESGFCRAAESVSARLEKPLKNPIYSIVY